MAQEPPVNAAGSARSLLRKEDDRHLRGRGEFVADIALPGTRRGRRSWRSPHAHAQIDSISVPPAARGRVFTAADLPRIKPIRVVTHAAGAKSPPWPPLATDKVRYVGEAIAACVAPTARRGRRPRRLPSRSIIEPLDAVVDAPRDMRGSRRPGARILGRQSVSIERTSRAATSKPPRAPPRSTVTPRIPHEPAIGRADGMPRRARLSRPPARRGRGLCLDPDAAHDARRARRNPRHRGALHPGRRTRCRRRLRAQGAALPGRDHPRRAGARSSTIRCAGSRIATSIC